MFNDYSKISSKAKHRSIHWEVHKILAPKKMLQRFPIGLTQVKAGITFENLLSEIRQIIYSSYRAKETTERVYGNVI